jgi:uncharacterized protein YukE
MARIRVNHDYLRSTAEAIEKRIETNEALMREIDAQVSEISSEWVGEDYVQYLQQWESAKKQNSLLQSTTDRLRDYAEFLRFVAVEYQNAQSDAVNRANRLPR